MPYREMLVHIHLPVLKLLSKDELMKKRYCLDQVFKLMDVRRDGQLDKKEVRQFVDVMSTWSAAADSSSLEECEKNQKLWRGIYTSWLEMADADQSNKLSRNEFLNAGKGIVF